MDYKLVKVNWIDSAQSPGWIYKDDLKDFNMQIKSVGYLVKETDESITLVAHIGEDSLCSPLQIPKIAIKSQEEIK